MVRPSGSSYDEAVDVQAAQTAHISDKQGNGIALMATTKSLGLALQQPEPRTPGCAVWPFEDVATNDAQSQLDFSATDPLPSLQALRCV